MIRKITLEQQPRDQSGRWVDLGVAKEDYIKVRLSEAQEIANIVADAYGVERIKINTNELRAEGIAVYAIVRIKGTRCNIPVSITIYNSKDNFKSKRQLTEIISHEMAHHILNIKKNSLRHTEEHDRLAVTIENYIRKNLMNLWKLKEDPY